MSIARMPTRAVSLAPSLTLNVSNFPSTNRPIFSITRSNCRRPSPSQPLFGTISILTFNNPNDCESQGRSCMAHCATNILGEAYTMQSKLSFVRLFICVIILSGLRPPANNLRSSRAGKEKKGAEVPVLCKGWSQSEILRCRNVLVRSTIGSVEFLCSALQ